MIKKQTWMAILATVVLLAGVGCGDSPEEGTEQEGPEKPEPEKPEPAPAFVLMLSEAEAMNFRISVESDDPQRNYFVGITTRADFDRLKTAQAVAETLVELEKGYGTIDWSRTARCASRSPTGPPPTISSSTAATRRSMPAGYGASNRRATMPWWYSALVPKVQLRPTFFMISSPRLPSCPPKTGSPSALPPNPPTSR